MDDKQPVNEPVRAFTDFGGTEFDVGYGLAGGGCGVYAVCVNCGAIVSKVQDED